MSQSGSLNTGGGGGGVSSVTGGQYLGNVPIMNAVTSGSNVTLYNNTWSTPYVVDSRTTDGEEGTYSTIQSAIDACFANGDAGPNTIGLIQIRGGGFASFYTEDLTFPDQSYFYLQGIGSAVSGNWQVLKVAILGNHTMVGASNVAAEGIYFAVNAGFAFSPVAQQNCFFYQCGLNFSANGGAVNMNNSMGIAGCETLDSPGLAAYNCSFTSIVAQNSGAIGCIDTTINTLVFDNSNAINGFFVRCTIGTTSGTVGTGQSTAPKFVDCQFSGPVNVTGGSSFAGCSKTPTSSLQSFYTSSVIPYIIPTVTGTVRIIRKVDSDYQVSEQDDYIGVTDTAAVRTITMPLTSNMVMNQEFEVKDESGAAGTNNIIVDGNGINIDGSPTFAINTNYGSARFLFDGTEIYVL